MTTKTRVVLDVETRSTVDLRKTNAYCYAQHPDTDVWLLRYAFTDDPQTIHKWSPGDPLPERLVNHILHGGIYSAHNAEFEYAIHTYILAERYGWPKLRVEQLTDTAARAARIGIPRSLENALPAIGSEFEKDKKGHALMLRMAKPRRVEEDGTIVWWDEPDRVERLGEYCDRDVIGQMHLEQQLPDLPPSEHAIWQATLRANVRGTNVDINFVRLAGEVLDWRLSEYDRELLRITDGQVKGVNDVNGIKAFVGNRIDGAPLDSLDKNIVAELLQGGLDDELAHRVLQIRAEAGKTSVAKFPAMNQHADLECVVRGLLIYYGAQATGRWSGVGIQVQNLPARGALGYQDAEWLIDYILHGSSAQDVNDVIEILHDQSLVEALSMCLRGCLAARPGHQIFCADYSNIEGRVAAWLGGEAAKLDAFRAFDKGEGPDLYKVTAGSILAKATADITKSERNVMGKVPELALGFQGGAGAFADMGKVYGVDMEDYSDLVRENLDNEFWHKAVENWDTFGKGSARVSQKAWLASEAIKLAWRDRHPGIRQAWYDCEDAAVNAVANIGQVYYACDRKLAFICKVMYGQKFLLMRLPSGRCIYYAGVKLKQSKTPWGSVKSQLQFRKVERGQAFTRTTYGGDLFQSAVQGIARDIMANGWLKVEEQGYKPLFAVHDEMVTEAEPDKVPDLEAFSAMLCDLPDWAEGLPVSAAGYMADRFRKD